MKGSTLAAGGFIGSHRAKRLKQEGCYACSTGAWQKKYASGDHIADLYYHLFIYQTHGS